MESCGSCSSRSMIEQAQRLKNSNRYYTLVLLERGVHKASHTITISTPPAATTLTPRARATSFRCPCCLAGGGGWGSCGGGWWWWWWWCCGCNLCVWPARVCGSCLLQQLSLLQPASPPQSKHPTTITRPRKQDPTNAHQLLRATTASGAPSAGGARVAVVVVVVVVVVLCCNLCVWAARLQSRVCGSCLLQLCVCSSLSTLDSLDMP